MTKESVGSGATSGRCWVPPELELGHLSNAGTANVDALMQRYTTGGCERVSGKKKNNPMGILSWDLNRDSNKSMGHEGQKRECHQDPLAHGYLL